MLLNLFKRKQPEYGKHTDILPTGFVPTDQSWMEYKQYTNDQNAYTVVYGESKSNHERRLKKEKDV